MARVYHSSRVSQLACIIARSQESYRIDVRPRISISSPKVLENIEWPRGVMVGGGGDAAKVPTMGRREGRWEVSLCLVARPQACVGDTANSSSRRGGHLQKRVRRPQPLTSNIRKLEVGN